MHAFLGFLVSFLYAFSVVQCGYPPTGDEIISGSVLLPATRRGRYLANIIRRQAVDGTGIKFNKDADRMNAESKKKVDVLSEELLPYIIAEQERRTTLYRRIMTAIQNGEKGVTIAEIRNKPPLIIRKGLMYRCPANRAPREPDGSGILMCEEDIDPTPIMYDSCLSAEDKDLYVAENRFFFCNRHRVEGPDLPRNGSTVIGCAPIERTSLNYTTRKCALEDTDDVVVHYRYYPDKTYKFVTELDPDHEVCDHWNPCQIGYIYSLPSPDQAMMANELWHDYVEKPTDYERDEIIPPIPEDSVLEYIWNLIENYESSGRRIKIPDGYEFKSIIHVRAGGKEFRYTLDKKNYIATVSKDKKYVTIKVTMFGVGSHYKPDIMQNLLGKYLAVFQKKGTTRKKMINFLEWSATNIHLYPQYVHMVPGQPPNTTRVQYKCRRCILQNVMVRSSDHNIYYLDSSKYRVTEENGVKYLEVDLDPSKPKDYGDYFGIFQTEDGLEERVKAITMLPPEKDTDDTFKVKRLNEAVDLHTHFDKTTSFECDGCDVMDILCNGVSVISEGHVTAVQGAKIISFNFPSFENEHACTYIAYFKKAGGQHFFQKVIAVLENKSPSVTIDKFSVKPPLAEGEQFEHSIKYACDDCTLEKVTLNGVPIPNNNRRAAAPISAVFYVNVLVPEKKILLRITKYNQAYEGVYQAIFSTPSEQITKSIFEFGEESKGDDKPEGGTDPPGGEETTASPAPLEGEGTTLSDDGSGSDTSVSPNSDASDTSSQSPSDDGSESPGTEASETTPEASA